MATFFDGDVLLVLRAIVLWCLTALSLSHTFSGFFRVLWLSCVGWASTMGFFIKSTTLILFQPIFLADYSCSNFLFDFFSGSTMFFLRKKYWRNKNTYEKDNDDANWFIHRESREKSQKFSKATINRKKKKNHVRGRNRAIGIPELHQSNRTEKSKISPIEGRQEISQQKSGHSSTRIICVGKVVPMENESWLKKRSSMSETWLVV